MREELDELGLTDAEMRGPLLPKLAVRRTVTSFLDTRCELRASTADAAVDDVSFLEPAVREQCELGANAVDSQPLVAVMEPLQRRFRLTARSVNQSGVRRSSWLVTNLIWW